MNSGMYVILVPLYHSVALRQLAFFWLLSVFYAFFKCFARYRKKNKVFFFHLVEQIHTYQKLAKKTLSCFLYATTILPYFSLTCFLWGQRGGLAAHYRVTTGLLWALTVSVAATGSAADLVKLRPHVGSHENPLFIKVLVVNTPKFSTSFGACRKFEISKNNLEHHGCQIAEVGQDGTQWRFLLHF